MQKSLIALIGATVVGLGSIAPSGHADAGCFNCAVGAGIVGGVAAGAIVGSAIANSPPPPPPGYYPPTRHHRRQERLTHRPLPMFSWRQAVIGDNVEFWVDGYGYQWRTVPVCP